MITVETIKNPIREVLEMVAKANKGVDLSKRNADSIGTELVKVQTAIQGLLPIEKSTIDQLKAFEVKLLREQILAKSDMKFANFPKFPMSAFTWRDKRGFPRLVPFSITSPNFIMGTVKETRWGYMSTRMPENRTKLPKAIQILYKDVLGLTRKMAREEGKSIRLRAEFSGMIPQEVRDQIGEVKGLFQDLFIVSEVKGWTVEKTVPVRKTDPLLVGWDGYQMWLLASFDTTSVEKYIEKMALSDLATAQQ